MDYANKLVRLTLKNSNNNNKKERKGTVGDSVAYLHTQKTLKWQCSIVANDSETSQTDLNIALLLSN